MRWAEKQRMAFIGERVREGKAVNRSDLIGKFGISRPQASNDIRTFMKVHPGAIRYDAKKRAYVAHNVQVGRDTTAAAESLMHANDTWLRDVALHDPDMIRDVAAALIYERKP